MEYTIINNNPYNFKVTYEINGNQQVARLQNASVYVRIKKGLNVTINPYGRVFGDGEEIRYRKMTEEELFQAMTVDRLVDEKLFAAQLLTAWYNNGEQMTEEIFDRLVNPVQKNVVRLKGKNKTKI